MKPHLVVGIDPGQEGGIALLDIGHTFAEAVPMPVATKEFARYMRDIAPRTLRVFLEKGQSMPKQGIASAFNYGRHNGELIGVLTAYDIPFMLVTPLLWTRQLHQGCQGATPKAKSIQACQRLFPQVDLMPGKKRTPHLGLVDALLIAEYGRRSFGSVVHGPGKAV